MSKRRYRKKRKKKTSNFGCLIFILIVGVLLFAGGMKIFDRIYTYDSYTQQNVLKKHRKFINALLPAANDVQRRYNILVSISLAQAILESNWGTSQLSSQYNNLYGVKASGNQPSVNLSTQEFVNGQFITITGRFRVYNSWSESVESHALLLVNGTDWNPNQYKDVIDSDNYVAAAKGLQVDGYATDPTYRNKIIEIIRKYKLYQYDKQTTTTGGTSNETTGR